MHTFGLIVCSVVLLGCACATPIVGNAHAQDLLKAFENVEQIYREAQPRPPTPSSSATVSPSTVYSLTPSRSPDPSPSVSASRSAKASPPPTGLKSRDITIGVKPETGVIQPDEGRRYPFWLPQGSEAIMGRAYQWRLKPNRFSFLRKNVDLKFPEKGTPSVAQSTVVALDDPEHLLNVLTGYNGTNASQPENVVSEVFYQDPITNSRPIGAVHRYLGYVPISTKWTGHPYFEAIDRVQAHCTYSRSFNCVPVQFLSPQPSPTPSQTPSSSPPPPSATSSPSPSPQPPEPEIDLSELNALKNSIPPFQEDQPAPPETPETPDTPVIPDDFEIDDLFPPPAPEPVGAVVPEPIEVKTVLVMRTVAGGTTDAAPYSAAKGEVEKPTTRVDTNTGSEVTPEEVTVAASPAGTGIN